MNNRMVLSVIPHVAENQGLCLQQREGTANIANFSFLIRRDRTKLDSH